MSAMVTRPTTSVGQLNRLGVDQQVDAAREAIVAVPDGAREVRELPEDDVDADRADESRP